MASQGHAVSVVDEKGQTKTVTAKVARYRPGFAPAYAPSKPGSDSGDSDGEATPAAARVRAMLRGSGAVGGGAPVVAVKLDDGRAGHHRARRRPVYEGEIVQASGAAPEPHESLESADHDQSEDAIARRRDLMRKRALQRRREEEEEQQRAEEVKQELDRDQNEALPRKRAAVKSDDDVKIKDENADMESDQPEDSEEEEDSDEEEESEEEEDRPRLKAVFVPKHARETIALRDKRLQDEEEAEEKRLRLLDERKKETHQMVADVVRRELEATDKPDTDSMVPDVDDTDGVNDEEEFEAWKLRELLRIKRDKEERERHDQEQAEIERRRNMTEEERQKEDAERLAPKEKPKLKFMQRYYHKGAFYQDTDDNVIQREVYEPTLEDRFDKTLLPEVMQVKRFGRAGQTKYTHLAKEDTTKFDAPWADKKSAITNKTVGKLAGFKNANRFDKPTARKR